MESHSFTSILNTFLPDLPTHPSSLLQHVYTLMGETKRDPLMLDSVT